MPDTLVFNVGEALEVATGGYLRANVHRVIGPLEGVDRYSVPFFLAPRLDAVVEPLALPDDLAAQARGVEQDPDEPDLRRSTAARRWSGGCARTPRSHAAGTPTCSRTRRGTPR